MGARTTDRTKKKTSTTRRGCLIELACHRLKLILIDRKIAFNQRVYFSNGEKTTIYRKTFWRKNSIVEIIIAQAGDTFNRRGTRPERRSNEWSMSRRDLPLYQLARPPSANNWRRTSIVRSWTNRFSFPNWTCRIDLTVSNGCVMIVAKAPDREEMRRRRRTIDLTTQCARIESSESGRCFELFGDQY